MSLLDLFRPTAEPQYGPETVPAAVPSRRDRAARAGSAILEESLAQKVMHGWLQNRHQTLVPLTLNLRVLSDEQRALIADTLAALLLAGRPAPAAHERTEAMRAWLAGLGADPAAIDRFDRALQTPPPLDQVLERAIALDVPVFAYVASLAAADPRFPASVLLSDVLEARFDLPTAVVRSVVRRYKR